MKTLFLHYGIEDDEVVNSLQKMWFETPIQRGWGALFVFSSNFHHFV